MNSAPQHKSDSKKSSESKKKDDDDEDGDDDDEEEDEEYEEGDDDEEEEQDDEEGAKSGSKRKRVSDNPECFSRYIEGVGLRVARRVQNDEPKSSAKKDDKPAPTKK